MRKELWFLVNWKYDNNNNNINNNNNNNNNGLILNLSIIQFMLIVTINSFIE